MLALFEADMEPPEELKKYTGLYVEKPRMPMAMTQMTEDEIKLSTKNWNSEVVLRSSSKAAGGVQVPGGTTGIAGGPGTGTVGGGGRDPGSLGVMGDRDSRQMSERGNASSGMTAAGILSSSPRGPPGSLARIPLEQRGLLSSLGARPSGIRNLIGRNPNLYMRSQSHDEDGAEGDGTTTGATAGGFETRFGAGLPGQPRQPNSLRARFENSSRVPAGVSGGAAAGGTKTIDIKTGNPIDGEPGSEQRRSVFDRPLPASKYGTSAEDRSIRKDINGRPIQANDWRSREWSGAPDGRGPKMTSEDRSWRSTRSGAPTDDWRSNNNSTNAPSSWYTKADDQRNSVRGPGPQNQENLNPSFGGKPDPTRKPSGEERQDEDGQDGTSGRHRRDSLPEWSMADPLPGDKIGSFDASGAFRETVRPTSNNNASSMFNRTDDAGLHSNLREAAQKQQQQQGNLNPGFKQGKPEAQTRPGIATTNQQERPGHDEDEDILGASSRRRRDSLPEWSMADPLSGDKIGSFDASGAFRETARAGNALSNKERSNQQQQEQPSTFDMKSVAAAVDSTFDSNQQQQQQQQQKPIFLPFNHEDSQQWFYRDTQSVVQGPFSTTEMFEWYKAGYFVKELLVRRACDEIFYPLGEVIKMWDRIPFAPIPMNVPPPPPITGQMLLQFRAMTKQLELATLSSQGQIPPNAFGLAHPGAATVLLREPAALLQQQQQQQVHQVLAPTSLSQVSVTNSEQQQAGIRQILEAARQHDQQSLVQQQQQQQQQRAGPQANAVDQNEMQTQLRQLLAQLKDREGFANLNAQEQQEVLVRQFVAARGAMPGVGGLAQDREQAAMLQQRAQMIPFLPFFNPEQDRVRFQQQLELERRQKEEADKQNRFMMEQRMKAEEEKQRIMDELQQQQRKQKAAETELARQEAEQERILKLSQLKQQQLAKQQEEFRQQMQNQQRIQQQQQQEKTRQLQQQQQSQQQLNSIQQQQQQIERAKKAAQTQQQVQQQEQQSRKPAWSTVSKPDQEPVSLATLQKLQEEEKERERQRQIQQQLQSNQSQQQIQQQLARQMTWASAAQQPKVAPVKTLAEIQKEEEERLAKEKQKNKTKVQPTIPNAGVWNNAASHLSWKNPPADS